MTKTGWIGEEPAAAGPALPVTNLMLSMRQRGLGDVLENALARSRAAEAREIRDEAPRPVTRMSTPRTWWPAATCRGRSASFP